VLADALRSLADLRLTDEDGETHARELLPPATEAARMHEEVVHRIWREHPGLLTPEEAARRTDATLAAFAATLPVEARIADLRNAHPGQGFAWGRFGPRTELRRAGRERLWALIPPAPRPGLLRRLFGSSS
jgi:hypothetical protein